MELPLESFKDFYSKTVNRFPISKQTIEGFLNFLANNFKDKNTLIRFINKHENEFMPILNCLIVAGNAVHLHHILRKSPELVPTIRNFAVAYPEVINFLQKVVAR